MKHPIKLLILGLILICQTSSGADWIPYIRNFSRSEYNADAQNWAITQDEGGWVYVANNDGLLSYDGNTWSRCDDPDVRSARSVLVSSTGRVHYGSYNCFGYVELNQDGRYHRHEYSPNVGNFSDVWNIFEIDQALYYISYNHIFKVVGEDGNDEMSIIDTEDKIVCSASCNETIYLYLAGKGMAILAGNQIVPLETPPVLTTENIVSILPHQDGKWILVAESGKFYSYENGSVRKMNNDAEEFLSRSQPYSAGIHENTLFVGTIHSGLFIIDLTTGKSSRISSEIGLQNNSVHRIHVTPLGNVWLGLDNGISYVDIRSPLTNLYPSAKYGRGYAALVKGDEFFFGTNIGLFRTDWPIQDASDIKARQISGLNSQIWTVRSIGEDVLCGANAGAYSISGEKASPIDEENGYFNFQEIPGRKDMLLCGTYTGLTVLLKKGKSWTFGWKLEGFDKSCLRVFYDRPENAWWVDANGPIKLKFPEDYKTIQSIEYFPNNLRPYCCGDSVHLDSSGKIGIINDDYGNEWYMLGKKIYRDYTRDGVLKTDSLVTALVDNNTVKIFENVFTIDEKTAIISTLDGLCKYEIRDNDCVETDRYTFQLREFSVSSLKENIRYTLDSRQNPKNIPQKIKYSPDGVYHFKANTTDEQYSYSIQLSPVNPEPIRLGHNGGKEYTGLKEGRYVLSVWAENPMTGESESDSLSFTVTPPWQRSILAKIIYILLGLGLGTITLLGISRYTRRKTKAEFVSRLVEDAKKEERLKNEVLEHEKTILALQNEKLQESIRLKSNDISNSMLNILQNQELLSSILNDTQKVSRLISESKIDSAANATKQLAEKVKENLQTQESWKVLEDNFNVVHHDFISRIKEAYPQLNYNDIKLAVYIRMNLLTKEIAPLMGISERGLESARFRLRHKLNLAKSERLSEFLYKF